MQRDTFLLVALARSLVQLAIERKKRVEMSTG
eukprot:CAMPEP_0181176226 /NCGR_PEP_ID=MMETSP1096-20121128/4513_1 /TAXON_ID=156174 ORGANISM="Chrysochromulina ericina, Strain CCMP281" /NCGR_SAMPLE_ID=MMETSP1096 /ASSEMBLY_ACC=CAM_ASM_000453 /LENGTH=31 /DNA_ID= /DNA_START= /DNA_END= /DNA_ORIENTATION=